MRKTLIITLLLTFSNVIKAQNDTTTTTKIEAKKVAKTRGGLGFYPLSKSISFKSSMSRRVYFDAKAYFEISNVMLYKFRTAVNYRMVNKENLKLYSGIGIDFESRTKGLAIPFGLEFFPFERLKTLSIDLESGLKFLLIPGYTHIGLNGDIGITYYFTRTKKQKQ